MEVCWYISCDFIIMYSSLATLSHKTIYWRHKCPYPTRPAGPSKSAWVSEPWPHSSNENAWQKEIRMLSFWIHFIWNWYYFLLLHFLLPVFASKCVHPECNSETVLSSNIFCGMRRGFGTIGSVPGSKQHWPCLLSPHITILPLSETHTYKKKQLSSEHINGNHILNNC